MRVPKTFSLDSERDADLLRYLNGLPEKQRSKTIRDALRAHISAGPTMADLLQAIRDLERKLLQGRAAGSPVQAGAAPARPAGDEPTEAAAALDELGL